MKHLSILPLCGLLLAGPALAQVPAAFAPIVTYSTLNIGLLGHNPNSIEVADVNGDDQLDLLTTHDGDNTVGIQLGLGQGTFGAVTIYPMGVGSLPHSAKVADVNGDGKPDLLVANYGYGMLGVLLGTGTGAFGTITTYSASGGTNSTPYSLAVADVNQDGKMDVLTANSSAGTLSVLLGTGAGSFALLAIYSTGAVNHPVHLAVADVNQDGKLDVVIVNQSTSVAGVLLGTGTGSFGSVTTYSTGSNSYPENIVVADVNGDGRPDLLTANTGNDTAGVLLGTGAGSFGAVASYSTGRHPKGIEAADVNGDGKLDLLLANSGSNTAGVLLGTGSGTFGASTAYPADANGYPWDIAVADVNGDGRPDLLTANGLSATTGVLLNTTSGFLPTRAALPGTSATLAPNPATAAATLTVTGLPTAVRTVEATVLTPLGQQVRRLSVPAMAGVATAAVPTAGLAAGLYLLQLAAVDAQGAVLGALPVQRLSVE